MKEPDGDVFDDIADRPLSPHRNLVTPEGLAQIDAEIERLHALVSQAQEAHDRTATARAQRDLRYWQARRASAELVPPMADRVKVHFGSNVKIHYEDGREMKFRIVGEDEADPSQGSVSHVSPLAQALLGKQVGDEAKVAGQDVEVTAISG